MYIDIYPGLANKIYLKYIDKLIEIKNGNPGTGKVDLLDANIFSLFFKCQVTTDVYVNYWCINTMFTFRAFHIYMHMLRTVCPHPYLLMGVHFLISSTRTRH